MNPSTRPNQATLPDRLGQGNGWHAILLWTIVAISSGIGQCTSAETGEATVYRSQQETIVASLKEQVRAMMDSLSPAALAGYQHLIQNVYLPADFDSEVFSELAKVKFPIPLLDVSLPENDRESTMMRFGLSTRPDDATKTLQYVVKDDGRYVMNCFACHGGNLMGVSYPGAPNTTYALETLTEQVRRAKLRLSKPMTHMDIGSALMPLGTTVGTSNAVMFGVALMNFRDADLNIHPQRLGAAMTNHDMDAPPWWQFKRKSHIYIDGFAEKGHRGLMQFILVKENGPKQFQEWENDFRDVYAFLMEVRAPKYPLDVDEELSAVGRKAFEANCSQCHGTYGPGGKYPEKRVSIDGLGTDRVRLDALTVKHRENYGKSWFAHYGKQETYSEVDGYVAPPLDGIWASAPYLHNGSVPTLWHMLHPDDRPVLWRRIQLALDLEKMGLGIEVIEEIPNGISPAERRWYFDTRLTGKSARGHDFPGRLSEIEKRAVLEYLKTL